MIGSQAAVGFVFAGLLATGVGCSRKAEVSQTIDPARLQMFSPLPKETPPPAGSLADEQISLGRMLYYETRLSTDQKISCNTCHELDKYGVDGEATSGGHKGQKGSRNSPTVYNAAGHVAQFWDGRAANLEEQAKGPVMNPVEMAMPSEKVVVAVLKSMPGYMKAFKAAFPKEKDPVTFDNMAKAIGAFERKLTTPSRWDKFLEGDQAALTPAEKQGFNTYVTAGCQTCHSGALVGAGLYQKLGVTKPYPDEADLGRFQLTKSAGDKMVFKVPSLRNVEKTGPYFHNGKVGTLEQAVTEMAEYQVGKKLSDAETQSIVTWLKSLTGEIPAEYIKPPKLPESTAKTPKAEAEG
jgi:cytochrome c peroxidase